jgi:hypothetical protein
VVFRVSDGVGTRNIGHFVAQWPACRLPCQRFTYGRPHDRPRMTRGPWIVQPPGSMFAWGVLFGDGDVLSPGKTDHDYVRASAWRLCTVGHSMNNVLPWIIVAP